MKKHIFLFEIGTEELPSKILKKLGKDFSQQVKDELKNNHINYKKMDYFISSCHLGVKIKIFIEDDFSSKLDLFNNINKTINFHFGKNNNNAQSKNDFTYNDHDQLIVGNYNFSKWVYKIVSKVLMNLNSYEMMRWGMISTPFIRPVRTITILLDDYLILFDSSYFFGVRIDRKLYGNRFMKGKKIIINHANDYPDILINKGYVMVDYNLRKKTIEMKVENEAKRLGGTVNVQDNKLLLEEVTALTEWPVILSGKFDEKFLNIPYEVIIHIMKCDQKYFPVYICNSNKLLPFFIFVSNTVVKNYEKIIIGYENVIKTRLIDADFFLKHDYKYRLEERVHKLNNILFHSKLGTMYDKVSRITKLSGWIASRIGVNIEQAKRAGYLSKCDLVSRMVYEFPFMQGIMGMYCALRDGEVEEVALAQKDHYLPKFSKDVLPMGYISCVVSIADKMDTISGILGVGEAPKGNRDPFGLKRCAIGILRILVQRKLSINLFDLVKNSVELYNDKLKDITVIINHVYNFMNKRLYAWYYSQGYGSDVIKATLNVKDFSLVKLDFRINAMNVFFKLHKQDSIRLCLIFKRISNILLKQKISNDYCIKLFLLQLPEERGLFIKLIEIEDKMKLFFEQNLYNDIFFTILSLCDLIEQFFDNILIMDKNQEIRVNRIALLIKSRSLFLEVADFSMLHVY